MINYIPSTNALMVNGSQGRDALMISPGDEALMIKDSSGGA